MIGSYKEQKGLTRKQQEVVGLLSVGTFLEYFDLMLYVHMAVFLNELFFPKYDSHIIQQFTMLQLSVLALFFDRLVH